ncbi:sucrose synthase 7-like protein [Tanacetum coccineum]
MVSRLIPDAHGTKCNEEIEPILNTLHSHILRAPFRTSKGINAAAKVVEVMECKPDLILGNYTDGNIMASVMAKRFGIIVDGVSGFHIVPNNGDESSNKIVDFFTKCKVDTEYWDRLSQSAL